MAATATARQRSNSLDLAAGGAIALGVDSSILKQLLEHDISSALGDRRTTRDKSKQRVF